MYFKSRGFASDKREKRLHGCHESVHIEINVITSDCFGEFLCTISCVCTRVFRSHKACVENSPENLGQTISLDIPAKFFGIKRTICRIFRFTYYPPCVRKNLWIVFSSFFCDKSTHRIDNCCYGARVQTPAEREEEAGCFGPPEIVPEPASGAQRNFFRRSVIMRFYWNSGLQVCVHSNPFTREGNVYSNPRVALDECGLRASGVELTSLTSDILQVDSGSDNFLGSSETLIVQSRITYNFGKCKLRALSKHRAIRGNH